jgi:hypothetical protein
MAKFEKFDPEKQIRGLVEAARAIQIEERARESQMVLFDPLVVAVEETREANPEE